MVSPTPLPAEAKRAPEISVRPTLRSLSISPTLRINEEVAAYRRAGREVYHMGFGEAPFPVHPAIRERIATFSDKNSYLPSLGLPELREKASAYLRRKLSLDATDHSVIVGPGSKELIFDVQLAVDGDLLFPAPSWVSYIPQTYITRDEVIRIHLDLQEHYKLSADRLDEATLRAKERGHKPTKLILNYPNNPTGLSYTAAELADLAEVARSHELLVISDEIYALVSFAQEHVSIARYYPEGTIVTTGLSKHLSLGGFRLGIALLPATLDHILGTIRSIASETFSSVSSPIQYAVLAAFEESPEIEEYIRRCTEIHGAVTKYVWRKVRECGVDYPKPAGGFYLYPDFSHFRRDLADRGISTSEELATRLLSDVSVASLPGTAFGDLPENLRLRLSTVDYDGARALEVYDSPATWTEGRTDEFVETACPNVAEACRRLQRFFGV
ncbi:MAG: pyridoxal phosphate-dependent aminotransferase [Spirochaetaceae bacterium]